MPSMGETHVMANIWLVYWLMMVNVFFFYPDTWSQIKRKPKTSNPQKIYCHHGNLPVVVFCHRTPKTICSDFIELVELRAAHRVMHKSRAVHSKPMQGDQVVKMLNMIPPIDNGGETQ